MKLLSYWSIPTKTSACGSSLRLASFPNTSMQILLTLSLPCLCEQLESHFASMFSNTVALSRVESPDETRIMATAEVIPISLIQHFLTLFRGVDIISQDGSVRLLSPVTGEIITTFFPIFTADVCILPNLFSSLLIFSLSLSPSFSDVE